MLCRESTTERMSALPQYTVLLILRNVLSVYIECDRCDSGPIDCFWKFKELNSRGSEDIGMKCREMVIGYECVDLSGSH